MFTNRPTLQRISSAAAVGAGALVLLTACGGGDSTSAHRPTTDGVAATSGAGESNDADMMFAQMMIPHHQQAIEMAELAETRTHDAEIKGLALKIKAAQAPEIGTLQGWLKNWGVPVAIPSMRHGMPGKMADGDMNRLRKAGGAAFDERFLRLMIAHHNGAILMAKTEQTQGVNPQAKALAKAIQSSQEAEVEQMRKMLDRP